MLEPGVTLHVYGIVGAVDPHLAERLGHFAGALEDGGYTYLVFTAAKETQLPEAGIEPSYEATLPYEQWLDGDISTPVFEAGLTIVPPWCSAPQDAERVLHVEPSLVFGTGAHPTTRRCLRLIARLARSLHPPTTVLDLGCGTGLLGLAALRQGAERVWACDVCALAVEVARSNARRNSLSDAVEIALAPAGSFARPADLVLANLPPSALDELLDHPSLDHARWVVASGMLRSDMARLVERLTSSRHHIETFVDGCWHTALITC